MAVLALYLMHDITPAHRRAIRRGWSEDPRLALIPPMHATVDHDVHGHLMMVPRHRLVDTDGRGPGAA